MNAADFTRDERHALLVAVRRELRHAHSNLRGRLAKFGDAYDPARAEEWIGWLESVLVKLGGDPTELRRKDEARV